MWGTGVFSHTGILALHLIIRSKRDLIPLFWWRERKKKKAKVLTQQDIRKPWLTVHCGKCPSLGCLGACFGIFASGLARLQRAKDTNGAQRRLGVRSALLSAKGDPHFNLTTVLEFWNDGFGPRVRFPWIEILSVGRWTELREEGNYQAAGMLKQNLSGQSPLALHV